VFGVPFLLALSNYLDLSFEFATGTLFFEAFEAVRRLKEYCSS
jgi:hypothetical protein